MTYPPGAVFDGPTEIFQRDGRYLLITTGGREEGRYRLCGRTLCVRTGADAERCRTLERQAPRRYRADGQDFRLTPLP